MSTPNGWRIAPVQPPTYEAGVYIGYTDGVIRASGCIGRPRAPGLPVMLPTRPNAPGLRAEDAGRFAYLLGDLVAADRAGAMWPEPPGLWCGWAYDSGGRWAVGGAMSWSSALASSRGWSRPAVSYIIVPAEWTTEQVRAVYGDACVSRLFETLAAPAQPTPPCYHCGAPSVDTCPLCDKSVCRLCAEREGESCCPENDRTQGAGSGATQDSAAAETEAPVSNLCEDCGAPVHARINRISALCVYCLRRQGMSDVEQGRSIAAITVQPFRVERVPRERVRVGVQDMTGEDLCDLAGPGVWR